jgi:hypothetical protein
MDEVRRRGRVLGGAIAMALLGGAGIGWAVSAVRARRAAAEEAPGLKLVLNIAARRLHVYENGERTRTYTVSVGKPGHRTPVGSYRISRVEWNPWWHPPNSPWARGKKPTPPGPRNPMGRVKMYFRNLYFIHGTPETGTLGQAVSHGCVRMSNGNAIALARLVHEYGSPNVSKATIDRLVGNSKATRTIWLKRPIPFEVVSGAAEVHDGRLEIYATEGEIPARQVWDDAVRALAGAGFDLAALDRERLSVLVAQGLESTVTVSLDELRMATAPAGVR